MSITSRLPGLRFFVAALAAAGVIALQAPAFAQTALKKVTVALDWTPNTNHVGLFVAQKKGFFSETGLEVTILPYTDTAAGTLVSNRRADFGVVGVGMYSQKAAGADLRAIYAIVQSETGRLIVDAKKSKAMRPKDLDGLIYAGFGSAWEKNLLSTIIKQDGGKGEFRVVTLGTSAYEALANGTVDFTLAVFSWEGVQAGLTGQELRAFKYADYGVPDQHTTMIASSDAYLKDNGPTASAFVAAAAKGYAFAAANPGEAGDILVDANKAALTNPKLIQASMDYLVKNNLLRAADGTIGRLDPAKVNAIGNYLFNAGILIDKNGAKLTQAPDFSTFFSNDYQPKK